MKIARNAVAALLLSIFYLAPLGRISGQGKVNENFTYLSPVPQSIDNTQETNIIIKSKTVINAARLNNNLLQVMGSISGNHTGKLKLADDSKTLIFLPNSPFAEKETVSVILSEGLTALDGSNLGGLSFSFMVGSRLDKSIAARIIDSELQVPSAQNNAPRVPANSNDIKTISNQAGYNLPTDFPQLAVYNSNPTLGQIFLSTFSADSTYSRKNYLMILNNDGTPFYYKQTYYRTYGFTRQPNGLMSYYLSSGIYGFYLMDKSFNVVDSVSCGNGYPTDVHEFRILPNGHFIIIGLDLHTFDMSTIVPGGNTSATVQGIVIQELDRDKNVIFQWRSWDHYKITDAIGVDLTAQFVDYVHTNAVDIDYDGNIIISSRHLSEITKIDRQTGNIIWRFGGKNNQFSFLNDNIPFSYQHAVRRIDNGNLTIFDNGNFHYDASPSRALEYRLDESNHTAMLVWQYVNNPVEDSGAMGYVQRLDNGNNLIGWGFASPAVSEVTPTGQKLFELSFPANMYSYRAFKYNLDNSYYSSFTPKLKFPADETIADYPVNLTWDKSKYATSYRVQVSSDSSFSSLVCELAAYSDNNYKLTNVIPGGTYYWRVAANNNSSLEGGYSGYSAAKSFVVSGVTGVEKNNTPISFNLSQNYPNPFNPTTNISYSIAAASMVTLKVYDTIGREVAQLVNEQKEPGSYVVQFNGRNLASGIYFYQINAGSYIATKKLTLLK